LNDTCDISASYGRIGLSAIASSWSCWRQWLVS